MVSIGQGIGNFIVLESFKKGNKTWLKCRCVCGTIVEMRADSLIRTKRLNKSCGCLGGVSYGPKRRSNDIEIFTDRAEITVNHKGTPLKVIIDREMVPNLKKYRWYYSSRYIHTKYKLKQISLQHFILPKKEGFVIDHINRNPLDNRRCNLRYATIQQNSWNRSLKKFQGVNFDKHDRKWKASAVVGGKKILIDSFESQEESLMAYDFIVKMYRGNFSVTNMTDLNKEFLVRWKEKIIKRIQKEQDIITRLKERIGQIELVLTNSSISCTQDSPSPDAISRDNLLNPVASFSPEQPALQNDKEK